MNIRSKTAVFGVGRPKCGKRTHLFEIARTYGGHYFDTGASLRGLKEVLSDSPRVQKDVDYGFIEEFIRGLGQVNPELLRPLKEGGQVNDEFIIFFVKAWISTKKKERLLVIDGTPRSETQFRSITHFLKGNGFARKTVWFSTPAEECLRRPNRGGRDDEDLAVMERRMGDFTQFIQPLEELMRHKTDFIEVDNSNRPVEEVRAEILRELRLNGLVSKMFTAGVH